MFRLRQALALVLVLLAAAPTVSAAAAEFVWIEGEKPSSANIKVNAAGWGSKHFLSEGEWLHISIDADKVAKEAPADGVQLGYDFAVKQEATFEVWNRIGFEFVRSPFAWRIDDGEWKTVAPDELTTDLMELSFFAEVAWLKLGDRSLKAGAHKLEIKIPRQPNGKDKFQRILYASDAICIQAGKFHPNSKTKPNESGRDAADEDATKKVFQLPKAAEAGARAAVKLNGVWEVCRHDEQAPGEVAEPIRDFPEAPHWKAIAVPGDKNSLRPDLLFAHRLWYRTRVQVPEETAGRSFQLVFPQNNLNTTVYVNGVYCGFNKNPFARFSIDITKGVKPGVNEVWVGVKDAWYGYSASPKDPLKLRKKFNLPLKFSHDGFQDLAYPIWNHFQSGILVAPELVSAGRVYSADVFVKPSVARKELAVEATLVNRSSAAAAARVTCEAVNRETGKVEVSVSSLHDVETAAGAAKHLELTTDWKDPKLWQPDDPQMYLLRTTVRLDGKTVDVQETPFGFREWTTDGRDFKLNGVVWHGWADTHSHANKEEWLAFHRKTHQRFMRFWGVKWYDLTPDDALDFFDRSGVVVRRSGILDGEAIGYMAIENDPVLKKESPIKMDLMRNWRDQVVAQVAGERNHPSVMIWSIENEWLYINCINLYGGLMDLFEAEVVRTSDAVRTVDPTRPTMTDGGGATRANAMPVHGDHYTTGDFPRYPDLAYDPNPTGGGRGRWVWDQKRPRFIGEELFAQGHNPDFAYFGGEEVFVGQVRARPAVGLFVRMLTEGYRWSGNGAVHFWQMQDAAVGQYAANAPRAVFCRQWDWTFASGQEVKRTFGIFNDTHSDDPITFQYALEVAGKKSPLFSREYKIAPGGAEKFDLTLELPEVKGRHQGQLTLTLSVKGKEVFRDVKTLSLLAPAGAEKGGLSKLGEKELLVYDPQGSVAAFLKARKIPFTALKSLEKLPAAGKVLVIGKDALDAAQSTSSALAAFASAERTVIILEQQHPLKYQAIPADMEAAVNEGRTAFGEDLKHPALARLEQKDFFTWGPGEVVYRNAYVKPTRDARSLVQCDKRLQNSALVEAPAGNGLLLLCQLVVGEKLESNVVAQQLLLNLLDYGADYKLEYRPVVAAIDSDPHLPKVLEAIGLKHTRAASPIEAIAATSARIVVVAATPANLKQLADNAAKVKAFTDRGGYLVLHGLTPEGLSDYNKLVGFEHMIRPFGRERVTLPAHRHPLTAGLAAGDVALYSSKQIFNWQPGNYVAADVFSYVVDIEDVAPFARFPNDFLRNMVGGFTSADGWPLIVNVPAPEDPPLDWVLKLPREQELVEMEWTGNTFYYPVTRVELIADGKTKSFNVKPNNEPQTFPIEGGLKAKDLTLRLADWEKVPGKSRVTGLDNLVLKARRPAEFYQNVRPMLNLGAMMEYPRGKGGVILCNLLFKDEEDVPANVQKKRVIFATILRNLKAEFTGGKSVIAGANLNYQPLDLSKQANQYRDEKGWFGDKKYTFKDLPTGKNTFAGVPYTVYDFATSPVPTVVMLGGPGVPNKLPDEVKGIPVGRKADALFFLHAARLDARRSEKEIKERKQYELCRYIVHYEDGKSMDVPIYAEIDVEEFKQKTATAIPGAQIAWTKPYEGADFVAVAYSKQWDNPRPDAAIKSIDLVYGSQKRGVPVLLAVTAASREK